MASQVANVQDNVADFMLAEYNTLRELRMSLDTLGENRVNFYLATISGAAVALGLLNQLPIPLETLHFINGAILSGLMFLGFITFTRMVERTTKVIEYIRGMNRIRRYFSDKHPEIIQYLWLSVHDDTPPFGYTIFDFKTRRWGLTGLAALVGVINSIQVMITVVMYTRILLGLPAVWAFLIGILTFLCISIFQYEYLANRMKHKNEISEVRFPTSNITHKKANDTKRNK